MCRVNIDIYRKMEYRNIVEFLPKVFAKFICQPAILLCYQCFNCHFSIHILHIGLHKP